MASNSDLLFSITSPVYALPWPPQIGTPCKPVFIAVALIHSPMSSNSKNTPRFKVCSDTTGGNLRPSQAPTITAGAPKATYSNTEADRLPSKKTIIVRVAVARKK